MACILIVFRSWQIVVLALGNACATALLYFPSVINFNMACVFFSHRQLCVVIMLVYPFKNKHNLHRQNPGPSICPFILLGVATEDHCLQFWIGTGFLLNALPWNQTAQTDSTDWCIPASGVFCLHDLLSWPWHHWDSDMQSSDDGVNTIPNAQLGRTVNCWLFWII